MANGGVHNPVFEETADVREAQNSNQAKQQNGENPNKSIEVPEEVKSPHRLIYEIDESPGWFLCIALAFQHCIIAIGGLGLPLILAPFLCMQNTIPGYIGQAMVINSLAFVTGIVTFLQTTFGTRLPIMQGASAVFIPATISILTLPQNLCPSGPMNISLTNGSLLYNDTDGTIVDGTELWQKRMREIQGALAVASVLQLLLSLTGAIGFFMRFIGPLTVAPAITLIGLSLISVTGDFASAQWGIAAFTFVTLIIFSQYLKDVKIPICGYSKQKGCFKKTADLFKIFAVLITIILACILCQILTSTNVFPADRSKPAFRARTDARIEVLHNSPWFQFSYPGQWGLPVVTGAGVVGMIFAVIISMVESIGDYYACARLSNAPPPPTHAVNRGLAMEGLGSILSGVIGTSSATTSYSQNVGAIAITQVASRRVMQVAGILFFLLGMLGKFGAVIVLIPDPVMGGLFCIMFGMITAVGLSNLQYVDMNSPRNLFIIGFSIFMGMTVPGWMAANPYVIQTGVSELDQIFTVLLQSSLFIGFILGIFLDNTLPGTLEERGMLSWRSSSVRGDNTAQDSKKLKQRLAACYNLPFKTNFRFSRYVPILPEFNTKEEVLVQPKTPSV